jgi:hypothetical protein
MRIARKRGEGLRLEKPRIVLRDVETGKERRVPVPAGAIALSPDGRRLAVANASGIVIHDCTGGSPVTRLASPQARFGRPRRVLWPAAKDWLLCVIGEDGARATLWRIPLDGAAPTSLDVTVPTSPDLRVPSYDVRLDPRGQRIAFTAPGAEQGTEIWAMSKVRNALARLPRRASAAHSR